MDRGAACLLDEALGGLGGASGGPGGCELRQTVASHRLPPVAPLLYRPASIPRLLMNRIEGQAKRHCPDQGEHFVPLPSSQEREQRHISRASHSRLLSSTTLFFNSHLPDQAAHSASQFPLTAGVRGHA